MKRFAQTLLVAAIDASYAMGYVEGLFKTVARPAGLKSMGLKLAKRYMKHWWKHTQAKDLEDVRIYEIVRSRVALNFKHSMELMIIEGGTTSLLMTPFQFAGAAGSSFAWS